MRLISIARRAKLAAAVTIIASSALAQVWPERPVTVIVPYAAGGNTDIMARLASDALTQKLGQNFVVENRPGAGGAIGAQLVASSPPDGYRLLFGTTAQTSDRKSTRLNSSHIPLSRMPSSA